MLRLRVVPPRGEPYERRLDADTVVVGRGEGCDLVLADAFLSRRHARLQRDGDGWAIEDLGSRNGTRVNGQALSGRRPLLAGDVVELSASSFEVLGEGTIAPSTAGADDYDSTATDATFFRSAAEMLEAGSRAGSPDSGEDELLRIADRLRLVNEVHQDLGRSLALEELLDRMLDRVFDHLKPERGAIYLRNSEGGFYIAAQRSLPGTGDEALRSSSLIREVAEKGLAALVLDARTDERFSQAHSMLDFGVRSLLAAPLLDGEGSVGMIVLDSRLPIRQFTQEDMELLVSLASAAALRIRNVALAEEAAERRRMAAELSLARRIQVALLPEHLPEVPGWEIFAGNIPSRGVSGDFYEVVPRDGGLELVVVIADVSGKGMAASLLTASLEALLAVPLEEGLGPAEISTRVSPLLFRRTPPEKYATAFLTCLHGPTGEVRFTCAGHNPALLIRAGGAVERLTAGGPPLGLLPKAEYTSGSVVMEPGDNLLLYTDGTVEAVNAEDEEYGIERLSAICSAHRADSPADLAAAIEADVDAFVEGVPFADDRTLVVTRRTA